MNSWILYCYLALAAYAQVGSTPPNRKPNMITGHVLHKDGSPVNAAEVKVYFFSAYKGTGQFSTQTDDKGYFSFTPPPYGEGVVSASKASEGYPDAALALYGREGFNRLPRVNIKPDVAQDPINLEFEDPDAWIDWTIESDVTHERVHNVFCQVSWTDDPRVVASADAVQSQLVFVLPKHPVTIKITAPGFSDWVYKDENTGQQALLLKPGVHDQRIIVLRKLP